MSGHRRRRSAPRRSAVWGGIAVVALALAACGGDDDAEPPADEPADAPADDATSDPAPDDTDAAADDQDAGTGSDSSDGSDGASSDSGDERPSTYQPGPVEYRLVNLTAEPVDVYVRTQGLVQAFEIQLGVEPDSVTDLIAPPADGTFLVTTAGADDPECVSGCDQFLASLTAFPDDGPVHTVLLYDADGAIEAFDLWESPPSDSGNANAMVAADAAVGLFVVTAVDVADADFGLRLGYAGAPGCVDAVNLQGVLVGGNQTPAFEIPGGSVDVLLYDNQDRECAEQPVGGPFTVTGGPGSRTHVMLTGSPGALDAIVLPFAGEDGTAPSSGGDGSEDASADPDRDVAVALMADELAAQIGLPLADATCVAPYVVDAIGVADALPGGELIDLDAADTTIQDLAFEGLMEGVIACDIDPESLGG